MEGSCNSSGSSNGLDSGDDDSAAAVTYKDSEAAMWRFGSEKAKVGSEDSVGGNTGKLGFGRLRGWVIQAVAVKWGVKATQTFVYICYVEITKKSLISVNFGFYNFWSENRTESFGIYTFYFLA